MPYFGLLSFLLQAEVDSAIPMDDSFNALLRASFFSTALHLFNFITKKMFQCPTSGFFLFYCMGF